MVINIYCTIFFLIFLLFNFFFIFHFFPLFSFFSFFSSFFLLFSPFSFFSFFLLFHFFIFALIDICKYKLLCTNTKHILSTLLQSITCLHSRLLSPGNIMLIIIMCENFYKFAHQISANQVEAPSDPHMPLTSCKEELRAA